MLLSALRWIAVLPSSILAAVVVRLIAGPLNDLSISMMGIDPDAFMPKLATSASELHPGCRGSPAHRRTTKRFEHFDDGDRS